MRCLLCSLPLDDASAEMHPACAARNQARLLADEREKAAALKAAELWRQDRERAKRKGDK